MVVVAKGEPAENAPPSSGPSSAQGGAAGTCGKPGRLGFDRTA